MRKYTVENSEILMSANNKNTDWTKYRKIGKHTDKAEQIEIRSSRREKKKSNW